MLKETLGDYTHILDLIFAKLDELKIEEANLCDHLCYRVESLARYEELKLKLSNFSEKIAETLISKRMISIFKLNEPIIYKSFTITCIELPAPKANSFYVEGWEHAEFVIPDLVSFIKKYDHLSFNKKALDRKLNPELGLRINSQLQVKFHPLHIEEVIAIEATYL